MQEIILPIAIVWLIFLAYLYIPALFNRAPAEKFSTQYIRRSFGIFVLVVIGIIFVIRYGRETLIMRLIPDTIEAGIAGVALTIVGLLFAAYARYHLGKFWSSMVMIKAGHQLIRTGPYRYVRNPMYLGLIVAFIGLAIVIGELLAFFAVAIVVPAVWVKIRSEEEILLEKFGDEYLQYRREVKAIIPFVL